MARRWRSRSRAVICASVSSVSPVLRCTCTEPSCCESARLSQERGSVGCTSVDSWVSSCWRLLSVALSDGVALPETPFSSTSIGSAIVSGGCWARCWCVWRCAWLCRRGLLLCARRRGPCGVCVVCCRCGRGVGVKNLCFRGRSSGCAWLRACPK